MKKFNKAIVVLIICIMLFSLCACDNTQTPQSKTYTIQYSDDVGIHTVTVESGKLFSISPLPTRNGYIFTGLYDAEEGGTQYVNAGGSSVSTFMDGKDIVLYPQFRAKEYTLVLDYQGAAVTGSRSLSVGYNSLIADLPMNVSKENKIFMGWYTEPNREGTQVADCYGVIPAKNIVDESIFDLSDPKGYIYLYAGFKGQEYTVTFYLTDGGAPEEVRVEHGTNIADVQLETRVDGNAVIEWSKKKNDTNKEQIFNGKVYGAMVLYAAEYAPIIDFNANGGSAVRSVVARTGESISLPMPVRTNYKFVGWQDASDNTVNYTAMPSSSVSLTAKWQAMIIFDTNGGTDVTNISEPQGTRIVLPETEKAGYMFAGWYDEDGEKYISAAMPSVSLKLQAKYWKIERITKVLISSTSGIFCNQTSPNMDKYRYDLDLSDIYNSGIRQILLTVHYQSSHSQAKATNPKTTYMSWYSAKVTSDAYKLWSYNESHTEYKLQRYTRTTEIALDYPILYCCLYSNYSTYGAWQDFYVEIEYPDMSTLY